MFPYEGLLNEEDQKKLRNSALLNFGLSLLAQSAPSTTPQNLGGAIGKAGLNTLQSTNQETQGLLQGRLLKSKLEEAKRQQELQKGLLGLVGSKSQRYEPGQGQAPILDQPGTGLLGALEQGDPNALRDYYANVAQYDPKLGIGGLTSIAKNNVKPSNQLTGVYLAVRAKGGTTGNPNVDSLSPKQAEEMFTSIQPFFSFRQVNPLGEETTTYGPRNKILPPGGTNTVKSNQSPIEKAALDQRGARSVIGRARDLVDKLWVAEGNVTSRYKQAAELKFKEFTQSDKRVAEYTSLREGFLAPIIRALGEKGTLAEGDTARARELWPDFNDSREVALGKLDQIQNIFDGILSGKFSSLDQAIQSKDKPIKTWEQDGYLYRQLPDGTVQRKRK